MEIEDKVVGFVAETPMQFVDVFFIETLKTLKGHRHLRIAGQA